MNDGIEGARYDATVSSSVFGARRRVAMALWVDRHLHKNGGSTIREVMLRNEEAGKCVYYGYTQTREGWDRLMSYLRTVNGTNIEAAALPKVCVEAHASQASAEFTSRRIPDLLELRSLYARLRVPLKVVLTVRVRDPLSYYISFYRWRIAGLQRNGNVIRLSPRKSVVQPLGQGFLDWAPPNLQSIGLLHGDVELFAGLKAGGWPGVRSPTRRPHPYWVSHEQFGEKDYTQLLQTLGHYDVVAPLEEFDAHLLMVSDATGFPPLSAAEHSVVQPDPQGMRGVRLRDLEVCPDMAKCRAHIEKIAPWDVKLYQHVRQAFGVKLQGYGTEFAMRLATFKSEREHSQLGICDASHSAPLSTKCCCADRLPCFNLTKSERRYRVPPLCLPGPQKVQELVASDMPLGWCCTWRRERPPNPKKERRRARAKAKRAGHDF